MISKEVYAICQKENNQNTLLKCLENRHKELENNIENLMKAIESGQNLNFINENLNKRRMELAINIKTTDFSVVFPSKSI